MMRSAVPVILLAALVSASCATTPTSTASDAVPAEFVGAGTPLPITTGDAFREAVVGRPLRLVSNDVRATLQFDADNTASGTVVRGDGESSDMSLDWVWEGTVYCRTGSVGGTVLTRKCEAVELVPGVGIRLSYVSGEDAEEYWVFR